jgi:HEAT repeat protein
VVACLRSALGSADARLRWGATYALGRLGLVEPGMFAPLFEALGQRDGDRRWAAAELLATCARAHPDPVVAALLAAVSDPEAERRKMALYVLRDVAPASRAVHEATLRSLDDPAIGVRFAALAALARLQPVPPEACTLVLGLVRRDPDAGLRRAALCTLGDVGRGVSAVDAALAAAATSDDPGMRRAARVARRRFVAAQVPPARGGHGSG